VYGIAVAGVVFSTLFGKIVINNHNSQSEQNKTRSKRLIVDGDGVWNFVQGEPMLWIWIHFLYAPLID
jgi:gentisate 1,2-dioxygenase